MELNPSNRIGQGAEITLERSLTTTSASSRSNRIKIDKEHAVNRNRQNNRVAIFRDRESERRDPDYDRSYDRLVFFLVTHLFAAILLAHHEQGKLLWLFLPCFCSVVSYALYEVLHLTIVQNFSSQLQNISLIANDEILVKHVSTDASV